MSHPSYHPIILPSNYRGFTLIEMMIVIAIIFALLGLVLFPYTYYMQRSYVENTIDTVGQGWILAHKEVRNGKLYDINTNASKLLIFRKGSAIVEQYLLSGTTLPDLRAPIPASYKPESPIRFESDIVILGFSGAGVDTSNVLGYLIQAPFGEGRFFTGSSLITSTGIYLKVGYDGADLSSGRARQILLRTYLQ